MLFLQCLKLLLLVQGFYRILIGSLAVVRGESWIWLAKSLRWMLLNLLLATVVLLVPIIVKLMMILFETTLTSLPIHSLTSSTAVNDTWRVRLNVPRMSRIKEFRALILLLHLLWATYINSLTLINVSNFLIIHRKIFLVKILNSGFMIFGSDDFLDATWERSLSTSFRFGFNYLLVLSKFLWLGLVARIAIIVMISLLTIGKNVLLRCCRLLVNTWTRFARWCWFNRIYATVVASKSTLLCSCFPIAWVSLAIDLSFWSLV